MVSAATAEEPASDEAARPGPPRWARWLTAGSLAVAVVALVVTIRDVGLYTLGKYLKLIGWWWLAIVPMEVLSTTLHAAAMRAFMSPERIPLRHAVLAQLAGRAINAVTPSGNLGEVMKVSMLTEHVSQSRAVSTILLYNIVAFSVELLLIAVACLGIAVFVPTPSGVGGIIAATGAGCLVISVGLYVLVRRGMLASIAGLAVKLRVLSRARYGRWEAKLRGIDDKLRLVNGARVRDRRIGIAALTASRVNSMVLSLMILHAVGVPITAAFVAVWTVASFVIYFASTLVPMGVGVAEGGYWGFFRTMGHNPAQGVALVLARRTVTIMYAAIGLLLVTTNETVKRVKAQKTHKAAAAAHTPAPASLATPVAAAAVVVAIADDAK
ncbi:MAG TPA: lysylphosphatidylglycerol synthase transmembrane domain-containing protein [Kofleriaceae bacterium]|nr:lysylphosphatidylglycerol synthase transmembrane domain-containing protein [Kofleriaceae bacterium]